MYKIDNISSVFWKIAKSNIEDKIEELRKQLALYTGCDEEIYTLYAICDLAQSAFADFCASEACEAHSVKRFFNHLTPNLSYYRLFNEEPPNYTIEEKIILGVLESFRLVKVQELNPETKEYIPLVVY